MNDQQPKVSIVIPTKDRSSLLMETIESVRAQSCGEWELVVIDDRSSDDTPQRMEELCRSDGRIRYQRLDEARHGAPAARNFGARLASGELLIFLDADDLLAPHCLEQRAAVMLAKPQLDFAVFPCQLMQEKPGDIPLLWNADTGEDDLDRFLRNDTPWQTSSPIWRRAALAKVGAWDEQALSGQDWEFHIRAVAAGLRYERHGRPDCYWRVPSAQRASIGMDATGPAHALGHVQLLGRLLPLLRDKNLLNDRRRQLFAGLYMKAAERVSRKVSRREGRRVWAVTRKERLVSQGQYLQGALYFALHSNDTWRRRIRRWMDRTWPDEMLGLRSPTYLKAPLHPQQVPAISVLMPVHNSEHYVEAAIDSIIRQTFRDWEMILIDDGSTDGTLSILRRYAQQDRRITLLSWPNKGLTRSLNEGLKHCRGAFIARMDGDDISSASRFEKQVAYMREHPECVLLGARTVLIDPFDQFIGPMNEPLTHEEIDSALLRGNGGAVCHPLSMMRREAIERVGGYREQYNNSEDLDLFLRLVEIGRAANLPDVLLQYRRHPQSVSHLRHEKQATLKRTIVAEAYARRGMTMPQDWSFQPWKPKPVPLQLREWGWKALRGGRREIARRLALDAFRRSPLNVESWRLMFCAMRGR